MITEVLMQGVEPYRKGLSTDTKPTDVDNGSKFYEMDTDTWYNFDEENTSWIKAGESKYLVSIAVTTPPTDTSYYEGETFDDTDMVVTATYDDGTTGDVSSSVTYSTDPIEQGAESITISYTEDGVTRTTAQAITVTALALASIAVTTPPTDTTYIKGELFSSAGMVITATFNSGTTAVVTGYTVDPDDVLDVSDTEVTISYTYREVAQTTTQAITVTNALVSIAVTTPPTTTAYVNGDNFDETGMVITATYEDETTAEATGWTVTDGTSLTTGKTTVEVSYTEDEVTKTTTQAITVTNALVSIAVTTPPTKTTYVNEEDFDETAMVITATYEDESTAEATGWTVTDGTALAIGTTEVTISYTEDEVTKTTTQAITVIYLVSIAVTTPPTKTTYINGEDFDDTAMAITATYNDESAAVVTGWAVTDGTSLITGATEVNISYTEGGIEATTTQAITVTNALVSIAITTPPTTTAYINGENFDETGMVVTATYEDASTAEVTGWTITDGTSLTTGKTTVEVSYTEDEVNKTTTQAITVTNDLVSIAVTTPPTTTVYIEDDAFDDTGMVITATYEDASTAEAVGWSVVDGASLVEGQATVTISYTEDLIEKTTTQAITVTNDLVSIAVTTPPTTTAYVEGTAFDDTGMVITATYENSDTEAVTGYVVTNGDPLTGGQTTVTIQYTKLAVTEETTQAITADYALSSIAITTPPTTTTYTAGDDFDDTGMVVTATYSDESTAAITSYDILNAFNLEVTDTSVTIQYTEWGITKETTQAITVNPA